MGVPRRTEAGSMIEIEAGAVPLLGPDGYQGAMVVFWPLKGTRDPTDPREGSEMRVRLWGVRARRRCRGRRSRVRRKHAVRPGHRADGTELILDAGTGIRELGEDIVGLPPRPHPPHTPSCRPHPGADVLAPMFDSDARSRSGARPPRRAGDRLARYISNPFSPIEMRPRRQGLIRGHPEGRGGSEA